MADSSGAQVAAVSPEPTDSEAVAIVAAIELGLPGAASTGHGQEPVSRWRFSGRWWSRPVSSRRARPQG